MDEDIFTGENKAVLLGLVSQDMGVAFDCRGEYLMFSWLQRTRGPDIDNTLRNADTRLVAKVDQGKVYEFNAIFAIRNSSTIELIALGSEKTLELLREVRDARDRIQVGLHDRTNDTKWSATVSVQEVTREATRFMNACRLE